MGTIAWRRQHVGGRAHCPTVYGRRVWPCGTTGNMLLIEIDIDTLLLWAIGSLFLTILFYMFWDVHYFSRMFATQWWARLFQNKLKLHETGVIFGFCFTNDVDLFFPYMNNARYIRELDFARLDFCERTGLRAAISKAANGTVFQSVNFIHYENNITVLTLYKVTTQLIYWDERDLYLEHRFVAFNEERVFATVLSKLNVVGLDLHKVICDLADRDVILHPEKPAHIDEFCECIAASKSRLKKMELEE